MSWKVIDGGFHSLPFFTPPSLPSLASSSSPVPNQYLHFEALTIDLILSFFPICIVPASWTKTYAYRYTAIMKPLKPRMGRKATLGVIVLIWTMASIVSLPMFIFATTTTLHYQNGDMRVLCYTVWPDSATVPSYHEYMWASQFCSYFIKIGYRTNDR